MSASTTYLGDPFGLSGTPIYSLLQDPNMGFAAGLLSAAGPSRMPVSLGQGLAQGYGAAGQSLNQALERGRAAQQMQMTGAQLGQLMMQMDAVKRDMIRRGLIKGQQQDGNQDTGEESQIPIEGGTDAIVGTKVPDTAFGFTPPNGGNGALPMLKPPSFQGGGSAAGTPASTLGGPANANGSTSNSGGGSALDSLSNSNYDELFGYGGFKGLSDFLEKSLQPTDQIKNDQWAGITPAQRNAITTGIDLRPNQSRVQLGPDGKPVLSFVGSDPGANLQFKVDGSGNITASGVPGVTQAASDLAGAKTAGEGSALPYAGVDAKGNPLPVTSRTQATTGSTAPIRNNNPGALMPGGQLAQFQTPEQGLAALDQNLAAYGQHGINTLAGVISHWAPPGQNDTQSYIADVSKRLGLPPNQQIDLTNPNVRHAIATGIMLHENGPGAVFGGSQSAPANSNQQPQGGQPIYAAPPLGVPQAATNAQNVMMQSWTNLKNANSQAQVTNSYLQTIKSLAPLADTGRFSDKAQFIHGLLQTIGVNVNPGQMDPTTANDLMSKYGSQIVQRLSAGGMSTDAARQIVMAGTPNAHMTSTAIADAVDNLVAANKMLQAKSSYLLAPYNAGKADQYAQREQVFDQYADPRIWQLANMPAAQRGAWAASQPDGAELYQKALVARQNGWVK